MSDNKTVTEDKLLKPKTKKIIVSIFIILFSILLYIIFRSSYLEYKELGQNFISVFQTNIKYLISTFFVAFCFMYVSIIIANKSVKKGITIFFEKEKKQIPKLPNKSIAFILACIASFVFCIVYKNQIMLAFNSTSFGQIDPIFHLDFSYYVFLRPIVQKILLCLIGFSAGLILYIVLYYITLFNKYFDGIDKEMLKKSHLLNSVKNGICIIGILLCVYTLISTQDMLFGTIVRTRDDYALVGAGYVDSKIRLFGNIIFAFVMLFSIIQVAKKIKEGKIKEVIKPLLVIPGSLVCLFAIVYSYNFIFVSPKLLDLQSPYINENIKVTRQSYGIKIDENQLDYSGTITQDQILDNQETLDNIVILSKEQVLQSLKDTQSEKGYFKYDTATLEKYLIDGKEQLVYVAPRTIKSSGRTYQNKMYEYTHGFGLILVDATKTSQDGRIEYVQKSFDGSDNVVNVSKYQTYYGTDTNDIVATNTKNKKEYDYTDELGNDITSQYGGVSGLTLNFWDRLVLAIRKFDLGIAFNSEMTSSSKILLNRNIINRAKLVLPDLIYDSSAYPVITDDGKIKYVLDCYTFSGDVPYSQYTTIENKNRKVKINYIKNSIKVIVDSYDGDMKFYITDRDDPIAMAYYKMYPDVFEDKEIEIPQDISEHFVYPQYLYDIQSSMLNVYHSLKSDIVYRADDLWEKAKSGSSKTSSVIEPFYTMVSPAGKQPTMGLVQLFTPSEKKNVISYLIGSVENGVNTLNLYTFKDDSNVIGPVQLDLQLYDDENIEQQLDALDKTGTKVTTNFVAVPIDDTILYVKAIYQNFLNEKDSPILKKVIVASGNKVAIGDDVETAITNLFTTGATDIKVVNSDSSTALIEAIIQTNNDLKTSANNNNYEMFGRDLSKLQNLIQQLEVVLETNKDEEETEQTEETTEQEQAEETTEEIQTQEVVE